MLAIQGFYNDGVFEFKQRPPVKKGKFIMLFPEENQPAKKLMSKDESLRILRKYSGSIDRDIDIEKERDEYLNEKYGGSA